MNLLKSCPNFMLIPPRIEDNFAPEFRLISPLNYGLIPTAFRLTFALTSVLLSPEIRLISPEFRVFLPQIQASIPTEFGQISSLNSDLLPPEFMQILP